MGSSKKHQVDGESDCKKWVTAGVAIRQPLRSIKTGKPKEVECDNNDGGNDDERERSTTPTGRESRIPEKMACPRAPRKPRPSSACHYNGVRVREFFHPPDLESVFVQRHVESAN